MFRKNTAGQFIAFQGVDATTGGIKSGVTWTMRRCIDGTFAAGGGTVTEDSTNGWYKCALTQADTNGNNIAYNFTGSGAVPQTVNIVTTAGDPTDSVRFGLTALPNAAAGANTGLPVVGTQVPNATAGAAGGLFIAGSNAATTISGLTTGALSCTTITASGAVAFQSTFAVTTSTSLGALSATTFATSGTTTLNALTVTNALTVSGATTFTGNVGMAAGLNVTQSSSNTSALVVTGNGTGHGAVFTSGSGATGDGFRTVAASTNGSGHSHVSTGTGSGILTDKITASAAVAFQSTFAVTTSTSLGAISGSTLTLSGAVAFQSTFAVTTSTSLGAISGSTLTLSGAVAFQSTFAVTTSTSLGALSCTTLTASGATSLAAVSTSGTVTLNALTVTNAFTVSGATVHTGNVSMAAGLNITQSSANTSALVVTGNGTGHGAAITGGSGATGNAITLLSASTNGHGFKSTGTGTGDGMELTAGASGADLDADIAGTLTAVTTVNGLAANVITAAATAADFGTEIGTAVWASATRTLTSLSGLTVDTVTTLTNLPAITANWLTAAGTAADFTTEIQSGLATAAALATVDGIVDDILLDTAEIGAAGAGLTNINLPNQTMDIVGNITGNLSGSVGSVTGAIGGLTAAAIKDLFDTDSTTTYGSAVAGSLVKEIADNAGGSGLTVADIADGVWDEILSGHVVSGSAGEILGNVATGTPPTAAAIADAVWDEDASGHTTQGSFGQTMGDSVADGSGIHAYVAAIYNLVDTVVVPTVGAIVADTNEVQISLAAGGLIESMVDDLQTEVDGIQADTEDIQSRLPTALVNSRMDCTIDGTGMEAGAVDAILNRDASASTTNSTLGAIVNDWENGGRLDLIVDDILADTAVIGATGGGLTSLAQAATALTSATWTNARAGYLDNINNATIAAAVFPTDPADQSLVIAATTSILTAVNLIPTTAAPTAAANAAAWGARDVGNGRTADYFLQGGFNKVVRNATTLTVYSTDDATILATGPLSENGTLNPIASVDPT